MFKSIVVIGSAALTAWAVPATAAVITPDSANSGSYQVNGQEGVGSTNNSAETRYGYLANTGNGTYRTYSTVFSFVVTEEVAGAVNAGDDLAFFVSTGSSASGPTPATVEFLDVTEGTYVQSTTNFASLLGSGTSIGSISSLSASTEYGGTVSSPTFVMTDTQLGTLAAGQRIWVGITPPGFVQSSNAWLTFTETGTETSGTRLVTVPEPAWVSIAAVGVLGLMRRRGR
jgi:hypothetical protein